MGPMMSFLGMPGGKELGELGQNLAYKYNPNFATSMKQAESPIAVDMAMLRQAQGDPQSTAALTMKLQQDLGLVKVADRSGTRSTYNVNTGQWDTIEPLYRHQTSGRSSLIDPRLCRRCGSEGLRRGAWKSHRRNL